MKLLITALIPILFLTGCFKTTTGNGFSVPAYTKEQRAQVHGEITDENGNVTAPMTVEFLKDYKVLRDQVRVK